jgi:threonine/homoserine/homoserine lactone efflux protein
MNGDVKTGFYVGIGLLAAVVIWKLAARLGAGALSAAPNV